MQNYHGDREPDGNNYFTQIADRLDRRRTGFEYMVNYLQALPHPPRIIETGCVRYPNGISGDGHSSLIFDSIANLTDGRFTTVDNSEESVQCCRQLVSNRAEVIHGDSIQWLQKLSQQDEKIDLLYLDSFDSFPELLIQAALHHLYEFFIIKQSLRPGSLIAVDDNWTTPEGGWIGKGMFVSDFMLKLNIYPVHLGYQLIWQIPNKP